MEGLSTSTSRLPPGLARRVAARVAERRPAALLLLSLSLAAGLLLRLWLAFHDDGIFWPDEIYQSLEPAHRVVFGYGLQPWEFAVGARNWAFPGFVALLLELFALLGLTDPHAYVPAIRVVFCVLSVGGAVGAYQLARSYGASSLPAAVGSALCLLAAPLIYFAPRAMNEPTAALPAVFGLAFALRPAPRRWQVVLGAALLALAVFFRLQAAIFCPGLLAVMVARRQWTAAVTAISVFAAAGLLFGLLDLLTWGSWFHSAIAYLRFNLVEGRSAEWGTSGRAYYPKVLLSSMGPAALVLAALCLAAVRRAPGLCALAAAFLVAHTLIPHKELRFLLPVLPILCALAGIGLQEVLQRAPTWAFRSVTGLALLAVAFSALTFHQLTLGRLGAGSISQPQASAYDQSGSVNRLLLAAHSRPDLCGLKVETADLAWTGGYTYLHRPVPIYQSGGPGEDSGKFNYTISGLGSSSAGEVVAVDGGQALRRLPMRSCVRDPAYPSRI